MRSILVVILIGLVAFSVSNAQSLPIPYQKWLDEDVAYIIEPWETTAFLALRTNAEREQFIKEFWRRRDPTPESEENEYREGYFKRIAYANQHFAFGAVAGWRADRGRVYILFGEPSERETTASGEIWKYKSPPDHIFEFVRVPGTHDLQLKASP